MAARPAARCAARRARPRPGCRRPPQRRRRAPRAPSPRGRDRITPALHGRRRHRAMLGQPYDSAARQPGGFDCSGLVVYAAASAASTAADGAGAAASGRARRRHELQARAISCSCISRARSCTSASRSTRTLHSRAGHRRPRAHRLARRVALLRRDSGRAARHQTRRDLRAADDIGYTPARSAHLHRNPP